MSSPRSFPQVWSIPAVCGILSLASCGKNKVVETGAVPLPADVPAVLGKNRAAEQPGPMARMQEKSRIHWQPWSKETFEAAGKARRLVFAVVSLPQMADTFPVIAELENDPEILSVINNNYTPVMVDADTARECGLISVELCTELNKAVRFPMFVWMAGEANPVAWVPAEAGDSKSNAELFRNSHAMVSAMWSDDMQYVLGNSERDDVQRRNRIAARNTARVSGRKDDGAEVKALRQFVSLYDPIGRTFDQSGGLFPSGSIELLAAATLNAGLPQDLREQSRKVLESLLEDILPGAMFDPLDGGVFSARAGGDWALPSYTRDCSTQARAAAALFAAHAATGDEMALRRAYEVLRFAENDYLLDGGLFALGATKGSRTRDWLWKVDEIEALLPPEDAAWWIRVSGMNPLGNLPSELDAERQYFRLNTISLSKSPTELASAANLSVDDFNRKFADIVGKLRAARERKLGTWRDASPHLSSTVRMASAYARAFAISGDAAWREKAVKTLAAAKKEFTQPEGIRLVTAAGDYPPAASAARAFHYALTANAALDVAEITGDPLWSAWADDIAATASEQFVADGYLKECPDDAVVIDAPVSDAVMMFDDSSSGLMSMAETRLVHSGGRIPAPLSAVIAGFPAEAARTPVMYTDFLTASLVREFPTRVIVGENPPPALQDELNRLIPRMVQKRKAAKDDAIPAGWVRVIRPGGEQAMTNTVQGLRDALLPSR